MAPTIGAPCIQGLLLLTRDVLGLSPSPYDFFRHSFGAFGSV